MYSSYLSRDNILLSKNRCSMRNIKLLDSFDLTESCNL